MQTTENVWIFYDLKFSDQSHTPFWEVCLSQPHLKDSILNLVKWTEHRRDQTRWSNGLSWVLTLTIYQVLLLYFKLRNRSDYHVNIMCLFSLRVVKSKKSGYFKIIASYSSIIIFMSLYRQESLFSRKLWLYVCMCMYLYLWISSQKKTKAKMKHNLKKKKLSGKIFLTFYRVL